MFAVSDGGSAAKGGLDMSDTSQGQGWWLASDGKWYPPETAPAAAVPVTPAGSPTQAMASGNTPSTEQSTQPPQPTVPQGWYVDPHNPTGQRFWNGTSWTEQTQVMAATVPPPTPGNSSTAMVIPASTIVRPCPTCGRDWGAGIACQFCGQVERLPSGVQLSSPGRRFGGYLMEFLLLIITLVIGYLIWTLIVFKDGQTPGKQVLKMRVVKLRTLRKASWGTMFLREFIAKPIVEVLSWVTFYIPYFWLLWDAKNQELWDKMVGTIVVDDRHNQLLTPSTNGVAP
jgi:RDD family/Protein of unknown function (DUF2510)